MGVATGKSAGAVHRTQADRTIESEEDGQLLQMLYVDGGRT